MYLSYLDDFGGIGPYIGRPDPQRFDTPAFGRASFVPPALSHCPRDSPAVWRWIP